LITQAAQHAFAEQAVIDVDEPFQAAVDQHQAQEQTAIDRQKGQPIGLADSTNKDIG
jgi:hypothetical protein